MKKLLITAGCSFTQYPNADTSWAFHLSNAMNIETLYLGQGAAGNAIISRKVIYNVLEALKKYKPEEILVGVMWSSAKRWDYYSSIEKDLGEYNKIDTGSINYSNPVIVAEEKNYYLVSDVWDDETSLMYYKYFYDDIGSKIVTIEHILRTQWFLEKHNVPYFMCEYYWDVFDKNIWPHHVQHSDVEYLYNQINFDYWISKNCYDFALNDSGFNFARPNDPHPSTEQHKAYTDQVIIPFLKRKNLWQQNAKIPV